MYYNDGSNPDKIVNLKIELSFPKGDTNDLDRYYGEIAYLRDEVRQLIQKIKKNKFRDSVIFYVDNEPLMVDSGKVFRN